MGGPIRRVGQRRQVVIPREIFDSLRLRVGDFVAFTKHGNGVLVQPRQAADSDDVLTPAEAKRLRQSLKRTRQGKTRPWAGIKRELGLCVQRQCRTGSSRPPEVYSKRVARVLAQMESDPFQGNVKALQGAGWKGVFRRRIGDYRLLFTADHTQKTFIVQQISLRTGKTYH